MADTKGAARAVQNPNPVIQGRKSNVNYAFIGAKHNHTAQRTGTVPSGTTTADDPGYYGESHCTSVPPCCTPYWHEHYPVNYVKHVVDYVKHAANHVKHV